MSYYSENNYAYGYPYSSYGGGLPRKSGALISRELPKDGNRSWRVTTQPIIEPVTVDEVKLFSGLDTTEEDTLIEGFIESARYAAEEYLGRAFISQTIQTVMDFWPSDVVALPRPPLISVDKVVALDEDDAETEYSSDNYYLNTNAIPGQLIIKRSTSWPTNSTRDYSRFLIQSIHGYGTAASDVPKPFREGITLWASVIYDTRTFDPKNPPPEVRSKFDLYRISTVMIR